MDRGEMNLIYCAATILNSNFSININSWFLTHLLKHSRLIAAAIESYESLLLPNFTKLVFNRMNETGTEYN